MNVEFESVVPRLEETEIIVVGGERFGRMEPKEYLKGRASYMACINVFPGPDGLICGHGDTKEAAITDAIEKGRLTARRLLTSIDEFESKLSS